MSSQTHDEKPEQSDRPSVGRRSVLIVRRLFELPEWALRNKLIAGLAALSILFALALVGIHIWVRTVASDVQIKFSAAEALRLLDERQFAQARDMAKRVRQFKRLMAGHEGTLDFVSGAAAAYEADLIENPMFRSRVYLPAARYLERAREQGFPEGREVQGLYLLGKSLYSSGQSARSLPVLKAVLDSSEENVPQIHLMLAGDYFSDIEQDLRAALDHSTQYLSNSSLDPSDRTEGLMLHARILLAKGDLSKARRTVETLKSDPTGQAEITILHSFLLILEGDQLRQTSKHEASTKYQDAIHHLREVQSRNSVASRDARKSSYLIGLAYRRSDDLHAARDQFLRTVRLFFDTEEGFVASLEEAEVLGQMELPDEALEAYLRTLQAAGLAKDFENNWIRLNELEGRFLEAYESFVNSNHCGHAITLANAFWPTFPKWRALKLKADAQAAWAKQMLSDASRRPESEADPILRRAREQMRSAGETFSKLARRRMATRDYTEHVWQSAENYLNGRDYENAIRMYREYLKNETRHRNARALVGLGEAQLATKQIDNAVKTLNEVIDFHSKTPASYQARLLAATAHSENGDFETAKMLLEDNLQNESLQTSSDEWRESLFALASLLYFEAIRLETRGRMSVSDTEDQEAMRARIEELEQMDHLAQTAIRKLDEAVRRYPEDRRVVQLRYWMAESFRLAARYPRVQRESVTIETTRSSLTRKMNAQLDIALAEYVRLRDDLNKRAEHLPLSHLELSILRNCYFSVGSVLCELSRYEEAIQAYSIATNRYQNGPESLEAFVRIAHCYRELNRPREARGTLEQAKLALNRIETNAPFERTTRFSRGEWIGFLDWLSTL